MALGDVTEALYNSTIFGYAFNEDGLKFNPIEFDYLSMAVMGLFVFISVLAALLIYAAVTKRNNVQANA